MSSASPADPAPSEQEILAVLDVHNRKPEGVCALPRDCARWDMI